jgi:predicted dehydrogenase
MSKFRVGVIGCGNIADRYVMDLLTYPEIEVAGVTDVDMAKAESFREQFGVSVYADTQAMLDDPSVDLVINLTPHFVHKEVSEKALNAGKHVYSEKPIALSPQDAWGLVDLANSKGLRLACSPFTVVGEAQQTAWKLIRDGKIGKVRVIFADVNWGRIESWHPAPVPFYEVGVLADVGVYMLTSLTTMFGPVRSVTSFGKVVLPDRVTKDGTPFHLTTPDFILTLLELGDGIQVRLTTDFYVSNQTSGQKGIEFHGDDGSLHLESFLDFDSPVYYGAFGAPMEPIDLVRVPPSKGLPWGRGVYGVVQAILEDRPHPYSGEQAAHLTDILAAANESMRTRETVAVTSTFPAPEPPDWAL